MEAAGKDEAHVPRLGSDAHERKMRTRMKLLRRRMSNMGGSQSSSYEEDRDEEDNIVIVRFRNRWESLYTANGFGSFESTTVVPPMLYTFGSTPKYAGKECTLLIFSIKVARLKEEGLHWPLHIYGLIATRDSIDPRRNLLFHRTRDNCQTITEGFPYLQLTGPSRAVVLLDPVTFEVQLTARGRTESEDKVLCIGTVYTQHHSGYLECAPQIFTSRLRWKRSELEIGFTVLSQSVEATIHVEIIDGSWPKHLRGQLTTGTAGIDHACIVLVDGRMPINGSGVIQLSRQVVSVELIGELKVDVVAYHVDDDNFYSDVAKGSVLFTPKEAAISYETCDLGFCKLGVTVGWSLFAPVEHEPWGRLLRCTQATPSSEGT